MVSVLERKLRNCKMFSEIVPSDTIKYEVDKETGYLKVDRPQKFSNIIPCFYMVSVPQTYCEDAVKDLAVANGSVGR